MDHHAPDPKWCGDEDALVPPGLPKERFDALRDARLAAVTEIRNNRLEDGVDERNRPVTDRPLEPLPAR